MKNAAACLFMFLTAFCTINAQNSKEMEKFKPIIKDFKEIQMVYYSFTGPYQQSFNEFGDLMAHIQSNNIPMGAHAIGVFYDDPTTVPENELRSEPGYMVTAKSNETEKFKYRTIRGGKAVCIKYKSMEAIMDAYTAMERYIEENKLETEPFSIEIYYNNDPEVVDAEIFMLLKE